MRESQSEMANLTDVAYEEIKRLCESGDLLANQEHYAEAVAVYQDAWLLLPEPKTQLDASTWILGALADALFLSGDFSSARDKLTLAMTCPNAIGNPFLHLRLGQCQYELKNWQRAGDELARAYLLEGKKLFQEEAQKYLTFVKSQLKPPPGGWPEGW
jgi:tetratricopeptide (TPR) repeat protein